MSLTFGNWIFIGILGLFGIILTTIFGWFIYDDNSYDDSIWSKFKGYIIGLIITLIIIFGLLFIINWYNTSTASGKRSFKDFKSEINNGIYREITITNDDGKVIYNYTGKCDIQEQDEVDERKLKFENEQGKRVIIYYGITDTVKIIEKDRNKEK